MRASRIYVWLGAVSQPHNDRLRQRPWRGAAGRPLQGKPSRGPRSSSSPMKTGPPVEMLLVSSHLFEVSPESQASRAVALQHQAHRFGRAPILRRNARRMTSHPTRRRSRQQLARPALVRARKSPSIALPHRDHRSHKRELERLCGRRSSLAQTRPPRALRCRDRRAAGSTNLLQRDQQSGRAQRLRLRGLWLPCQTALPPARAVRLSHA